MNSSTSKVYITDMRKRVSQSQPQRCQQIVKRKHQQKPQNLYRDVLIKSLIESQKKEKEQKQQKVQNKIPVPQVQSIDTAASVQQKSSSVPVSSKKRCTFCENLEHFYGECPSRIKILELSENVEQYQYAVKIFKALIELEAE